MRVGHEFVELVGARCSHCPDFFTLRLRGGGALHTVRREPHEDDDALFDRVLWTAQLVFMAGQGQHVLIACVYEVDPREDFKRTLFESMENDPDERVRAYAAELLCEMYFNIPARQPVYLQ